MSTQVLFDASTGTVLGYDPQSIYVVDIDELATQQSIVPEQANDLLCDEDRTTQLSAIAISPTLSELLK